MSTHRWPLDLPSLSAVHLLLHLSVSVAHLVILVDLRWLHLLYWARRTCCVDGSETFPHADPAAAFTATFAVRIGVEVFLLKRTALADVAGVEVHFWGCHCGFGDRIWGVRVRGIGAEMRGYEGLRHLILRNPLVYHPDIILEAVDRCRRIVFRRPLDRED